MATVLVVDGANVVGSVPDGWWRDRGGAAARLHAHLLSEPAGYDEVVLVLEGQGRRGVPAGVEGRVRTVHAAGEGDDEIVDQCSAAVGAGAEVSVATADRGLLARLDGLEGPDGLDGRDRLSVSVVGPRSVREEKTDG